MCKDGGLVCEELPAVRAAQGALDQTQLSNQRRHPVITIVHTQLSLLDQVLFPVVLDLLEPALKVAAGLTEAGFLLRAGQLC